MPAPTEIATEATKQWAKGVLQRDLMASLGRVLPGLGLGILAGLAVGLLTGRLRWASRTLSPLLHMWRALPAVALVPLFIQFLGIGEVSKISVITLGVFFPVWLNTHEGATLTEPDMIQLAKNLNIGPFGRLSLFILPATLPFTIAGIRVGVAVAYTMLFVAEWAGANAGVGYRISLAHIISRMDLLLLGLIVLGILAFATDTSVRYAVLKLFPWLRYSD